MKKLLVALFVLCVWLTGCNSSLPSWSNELVLSYNGYVYIVTDQKTQEDDKIIGQIGYHKIGKTFTLYSIKNVDDYSKIAVKTKEGFLLANKTNKKAP